MKNKIAEFAKVIEKRVFLLVSMILSIALLFYFTSVYIYKPVADTYEVSFTYNVKLEDYDILIEYDNLSKIKDKIITVRQEYIDRGEKAPYSDFSYVQIDKLSKKEHIKIEYVENVYSISVYTKYFNSELQAKRFITNLIENERVIGDRTVTYKLDTIVKTNIVVDEIATILLSLAISPAITMVILFVLYIIKKEWFLDNIEYDNKKIYKTPFHISLFKSSSKEMKTVKGLTVISVLLALQLASKFLSLPTGFENLRINPATFIFTIISALYGPVVGVVIGACSDILGFLIKPSGAFFFGYTLNAMLSGLVYGMCLYKTKITFTKCLTARIIIGLGINTFLGALWSSMLYENPYDFYLKLEFIKNLIFLIPQAVVTYLILYLLAPIFRRSKALDEQIANNITVF